MAYNGNGASIPRVSEFKLKEESQVRSRAWKPSASVQPVQANPLSQFQQKISMVPTWLSKIGVSDGRLDIDVSGLSPVPPIIHFIWLGPISSGSPPIPAKYVENIKRMVALNSRYKVWVWTDYDSRVPAIPGATKCIFPGLLNGLLDEIGDEPTAVTLSRAITNEWTLTQNYAAVSDILRVLILYAHGGIYCDTDNEALVGFPSPMPAFGMRVGTSGDRGAVTNALLASVDHFPFFQVFARRIAANYDLLVSHFGAHDRYASAFRDYKKVDVSSCNSVVNDLSGPACLNLLMDHTRIGGMQTTTGFLVPWKGFAIPPRFVHVGSDQTWLK